MRRRPEPGVYFPWEKRRGPFGTMGRARIRLVLVGAALVTLVVVIRRREEDAAAVRATRATLTTAGRAIAEYRADHAGACPHGMIEVVAGGYARDEPFDAWGRSLRLICPGHRDPAGFDVSSDGPDGLPGGLDRVE